MKKRITKKDYEQFCEDNFLEDDITQSLEALTKIYRWVDLELLKTELIITIPLIEK